MASLGNIYFNMGIKDDTQEDIKKILERLSKEELKLKLGLDDAQLGGLLDKLDKQSSKASKSASELSDKLKEVADKTKNVNDEGSKQTKNEIELLRHTESVARAKEKLFQLERSIVRSGFSNTEEMKATFDWITKAKKELANIDISNKSDVIVGTGAGLTAEINKHKEVLAILKLKEAEKVKQSNQDEARSNKEVSRIEKIIRSEEKLIDLEERISKAGLENNEKSKEILEWIATKRLEINSIEGSGANFRMATGAKLDSEINTRKKLIDTIKQQERASYTSSGNVVDNEERIARAVLRVQAVRNRITNDPFRNQDGYKAILSSLDGMIAKLKTINALNKKDVIAGTGTNLSAQLQDMETMIAKQDRFFRDTTNQTSTMGRMWGQMGNQIKQVLSIYAIQRFTKQLIEMGGEFEKQHYALRAIVGDLGKADQIFNNLRKVAVESPFHFGDFTSYAKQLSAFSIPVNGIYETTKRLADVSAGLGVGMDRIILAYGQIRAAGVLRGQEVRQLTEAGIPIIDELAKKLGVLRGEVVSTNQVFDAISRREVPFAMVKEVFEDMTNEGGKFHNMQEKLAQSLSGKWANVTSEFQLMLYDVSQQSRGVLDMLLDGISWLVKNYHVLSSAIVGLTSTYVAYKTILMLVKIQQDGLTASMVKLRGAILSTTGIFGAMTIAVGLLATAMNMMGQANKAREEELNRVIKAHDEVTRSIEGHMTSLMDLAIQEKEGVDVTTKRMEVLKALEHIEPEIAKNIRNHADSIEYLTEKTEEYLTGRKLATDLDTMFVTGSSYGKSVKEELSKTQEYQAEISALEAKMRVDIGKVGIGLRALENDKHSSFLYGVGDLGIEKAREILNSGKDVKDMYMELEKVLVRATETGFVSIFDSPIKSLEKANAKLSRAQVNTEEILSSYIESIKMRMPEGIDVNSEKYATSLKRALAWAQEIPSELKAEIIKRLIPNSKDEGAIDKAIESWQDYLNKYLGNLYAVQPDATQLSVADDIKKELDKAKKFIDGTDIDTVRKVTIGTTEDEKGEFMVAQETIKQYEYFTEAIIKYRGALKMLGTTEKETKADKKDPFAEQMKARVDIIKDAIATYEKYIPVLGKVNALEKVVSDKRFDGLNFDPDRTKESLVEIYASLGNTDAQKKLKDDIEKTFTDIDFTKIKGNMDNLARVIDGYIKSNKDRWDVFDELFEGSGDRNLSMQLAFGSLDDTEINNYIDSLKSKLSELTGEADVSSLLGVDINELESKYGAPIIKLIQTIKDEQLKASRDILLSDAKAISETMTLQQKADKISASYNEKISKTENEDAKASYLKLMNKELEDLYSRSLQLDPVWQKLFGNTSDYSYKMMKELVAQAKEMLATAKEITDEDGKGTGIFTMTGADGEQVKAPSQDINRLTKDIAKKEEELNKANPFAKLVKGWNDFANAKTPEDKEEALGKIAKGALEAGEFVTNLAGDMSQMFDALGQDGASKVADVGADIMEVGMNIGKGFAQGGPVGAAVGLLASLPKLIGNIGKKHDTNLDKKIKESARQVKLLESAYKNLSKEIERQLGAQTTQQTQKQLNALKQQRTEYYSMIQNESDKKKSDQDKIDDYRQQIKELTDQINYFYEDLAKTLYEIDIKGWANQFGDSIMEAWKKGEDGAMAFQKTANDILSNVANKMVTEMILEPVFKKMRKDLPKIMGDGKLSPDEIKDIAQNLVDVGSKYGDAMDKLDEINKAVIEASGGTLNLKGSEDLASNLGKGIQENITEDTAQILASYLNAIRQDVSVKRELISKLANAMENNISSDIAGCLAELKKIEANTARGAFGVESMVDIIESVVNGSKSFKTR